MFDSLKSDIMYNVTFIYHRINHHSAHSGYDVLAKYVNGETIKPSFASRIAKKVTWRVKRKIIDCSHMQWYSFALFEDELDALIKMSISRNTIFHYLYGEDAYRYLGLFPRRDNKLVISYHQPPEKFDVVVTNKSHLDKADGIIALSQNQYDYFKTITSHPAIFIIPHGVDTDFFRPSHDQKVHSTSVIRYLFVGNWLRDFETASMVMYKMKNEPEIEFTVVTPKANFKFFDSCPNVKLLCNIPENRLLSLYLSSDVLFLPVTDCTANNSVLEGMACGLPIITTDVGGIRDYVDESFAVLISQGETDSFCDALKDLARDDSRRAEMGKQARIRAITCFDWNVVANRMKQAYSQLFSS